MLVIIVNCFMAVGRKVAANLTIVNSANAVGLEWFSNE